jgi:cell division protein FtsZ
MKPESDAPASKVPSSAFRCRVIGVGNAGCNALESLAQAGLTSVDWLAVSTHARALAQCSVSERLVLGHARRFGLGTGGDPAEGRAAAEADQERLRAAAEGIDVVFVMAGLGGGTGGGAAPVVARIAKDAGALVLAVVTLPFDWEGARRQRQALDSLREIKSVADSVICVPNQKVFQVIDENTSVLETFQRINALLAQGVCGIWRLLSRPGLIRIDFADLCAATRGRHSESALATAEAQGEQRARVLMERLLAHPLIEGGTALAEADTLLVSLVGGPDLTMAEVRRVMEQINRHCQDAQVIVGAALDAALTGRLAVTVIAGRRDRAATTHSMTPEVESERPVEREAPPAASEDPQIETGFFRQPEAPRSTGRFVPPPPELSPEKREEILKRHSRSAKARARMKQGTLPLEIASKGRFEKSEPTLHHGEDLDVPTYVRRGVALN